MTKLTKYSVWTGVLALLLAVAFFPLPAQAQATVNIDLCATTGTATLPDGASVPVWGYALGDCTAAPTLSQPGGPVLAVNQGDTVVVTLYNSLSEATGLLFHGQSLPPDRTGAASGASATYTFVVTEPGTYLYEAGLLPNTYHQSAMGLHGVLVVRSATAGQAYNSASTAYDVEAVMLLSEIDPLLNNSATPASFDMRSYRPRYQLINGVAYPNTQPIDVAAGNRVLLRYVNGGALHHSMGVLGMTQRVVAIDGSLRPNAYSVVAETVAPGSSIDAIATVPANAPDGARFAVHAGDMTLFNSQAGGYGGMLTFMTIAAGTPGAGDTRGPAATGLGLVASGADRLLTAMIDDSAAGGSTIAAAEFVIDDTAATPTAMTATDGTFDSATEQVEGTIGAAVLAALTPGQHTVYVRGQDSAGNWGAYNLIALSADNAGPTTSALTLAPNPSSGAAGVALGGTASDVGSGNSNIAAAEYFVDLADPQAAPGSGTAMGINAIAQVASITATIPAGTVGALAEGTHTVSVRSQDESGQWGAFATIDLLIDRTGPETTNAVAAPNPSNGVIGVNPSQPAVRVDATVSEPAGGPVASNIQRVEGFIDSAGADGTGFPFTPRDGLYDSATENAYALIPLINLSQLADGAHQILVHGQDASGNWGTLVAAELVIDRTPPVVSGVAATPNPTNSAQQVTLTATTTDAAAIAAAEWFAGADPGPGNGTAMTVSAGDLSVTIDVSTWAVGSYTLSVRARDAAGNWSTPASVVLVVDDLIFADGFEAGNMSAWSATTGSPVVNTAAAMNGTYGMAVVLSPGIQGFVTDNTPAALTSYNARFLFNPNASRTVNGVETIFAGRNAGGTTIFSIEYRRPNPGSNPQIRATVLRQGGTTRTNWVNLVNAPQVIDIVWESGTATSLRLYVDGVQRQVRNNLNTSAYQVETVNLGPLAGLVNGTQYFDSFTSKRSPVVLPVP